MRIKNALHMAHLIRMVVTASQGVWEWTDARCVLVQKCLERSPNLDKDELVKWILKLSNGFSGKSVRFYSMLLVFMSCGGTQVCRKKVKGQDTAVNKLKFWTSSIVA